jgi:transcriptional regulator with XRE-family HTH domain
MEFCERLQALRKQKGLTQEELAEVLFVSRTAISKWESGRGYPSIDSLKAVSKFFGITIDELLSGDELLSIAEEDTRQESLRVRDLVYGLLDCSVVMFCFLPFFGQRTEGSVRTVTLLALTEIAPYLRVAYWAAVIGGVMWGILTLALQNCQRAIWVKSKSVVSLLLNVSGALLFMISLQPYAAAVLFVFLMIKVILLLKRR